MLGEGRCRSSSSVPVTPHGAGTKPPPPRPFLSQHGKCKLRALFGASRTACRGAPLPAVTPLRRHRPFLYLKTLPAIAKRPPTDTGGRANRPPRLIPTRGALWRSLQPPSTAPSPHDELRAPPPRLTCAAAAPGRPRSSGSPPGGTARGSCSGPRPCSALRLLSSQSRGTGAYPDLEGARRERGARLRTGRPKIQTPRRGALPGGSLSAGGSGPRPPPGKEPHPQRPTGISRSSSSTTVSSGSVAVTGEQSSALPLGALWGAAFPPWGGCTRPPRERMHAASWGCTWPPRGVARGRATWSCSCRARQGRAASPRSFLEQRLSSRDH